MIIEEVLDQLESAKGPVIKMVQQGAGFNLMVIGFKKGMTLKEHKTMVPARLIVIEGNVIYKQADLQVALDTKEDYAVPIDVTHSVTASADSICFLIQG